MTRCDAEKLIPKIPFSGWRVRSVLRGSWRGRNHYLQHTSGLQVFRLVKLKGFRTQSSWRPAYNYYIGFADNFLNHMYNDYAPVKTYKTPAGAIRHSLNRFKRELSKTQLELGKVLEGI